MIDMAWGKEKLPVVGELWPLALANTQMTIVASLWPLLGMLPNSSLNMTEEGKKEKKHIL